MSRQDNYSVSVAVDGIRLGVWDTLEGGEVDSEETKYRPGGMAPSVSLGGSTEVANVKVARLYDLARDHSIVHWLVGRVGRGAVTVTVQPLTPDAAAYGAPLVYRGVLKQVKPPEVDSTSSDPAMIELEVTPAGTVA